MSKPAKPMTPEAARRIQSGVAKVNGGVVPKDSFSTRATSAGDKNVNTGKVPGKK
ncbi:hypothetical protein C8E02_1125 [Vogesella indigofera]|uniref:Seed maturation protein n=1 Tax=Vogesella indigofera TaxID=45465 RepID=A0A495BJ27_VOGIN|nr:hypothetical protein [Vogesella indigofera]RKQ61354.1 hypothetical protein C8E02_1125 [Vogesella indigofera]